MNEENHPKGQVETDTILSENRLTYADLLQLDWILEDKIGEWEWRDDGLDDLIENSRKTLERVREMMKTTHRGWLAETNGVVVGFVMGNKQTGEMWVIPIFSSSSGVSSFCEIRAK